MLKRFFCGRTAVWFFVIVAIFILLRLPGVDTPLHQDENKWPAYLSPNAQEGTIIPHPPLGAFIYKTAGDLVGFDESFRWVPLIFGIANLLLIFYLAKILFDKKTAFWTAGLFTVSFFSVLASLMVDTDGAVMPFFFLLMSIGYIQLKNNNFQLSKWWILLLAPMVFGFLIKMSFLIGIAAFVLDFAIEKKVFSEKKKIIKLLGFGSGAIILLAAALLVSKFIFSSFNLESALQYGNRFANFSGRGWFQTGIQFIKAMLYLSPLLLIPVFFADREIIKKSRPFLLFISIGLVFYLILFDFSVGALDRYLQFLITPLVIICGAVFAKYLNKETKISNYFWPVVVSVAIFLIQFAGHYAPPLYPKTEWISRILSFKWNFLFPFTGGSGPLPFYISFAFMGISWLACVLAALAVFKSGISKKNFLIPILVLGIFYNVAFIEEYSFGQINGSTKVLIKKVTTFIKNTDDIKKVTVYNENGGWEIYSMGKYRKRLYIDPKFDVKEKIASLNLYKEHYLVVDIPTIDPNTVFQKYFNSCKIVYRALDKQISATVYDCRRAPNLKL